MNGRWIARADIAQTLPGLRVWLPDMRGRGCRTLPRTMSLANMLLIYNSLLILVVLTPPQPCLALGLERALGDSQRLNVTYLSENRPSALASLFSPRMDFEQWKPLTGRGDPLRNDPTYDYEPPVLERVHYWADDTRLERENYPEKKSEVLMLGVSSRKPSVTSRQPPLPPRRQQYRPMPPKYEDFTYKLSDTYPMTILVPPPPPPPGHQPSLFVLNQEKLPPTKSKFQVTDSPLFTTKDITTPTEKITSSYALQEANLIYQSSSTIQNWIHDHNQTLPPNINNIVSSDYAGWGPTTPLNEYESANDTHNLIINDILDAPKHPYAFYKPMLSEAPPPPPVQQSHISLPILPIPTTLPSTAEAEAVTTSLAEETWPAEHTTYETTSVAQDYYEDTTTDKPSTVVLQPIQNKPTSKPKPVVGLFDMLSPMMSMPIVNGPERPEDNLYAHATEIMQIFKEEKPEDRLKLENMQTMQPPPPVKVTESTTQSHKQPYHVNSNVISSLSHNKPSLHTHDPYLHMRYTTPAPTTASIDASDKIKPNTESVPYLIIQGHSKVKTYGSKPKPGVDVHTLNNEIPKPNETNEVKHLHPIKEKFAKKLNTSEPSRTSRAQNLKGLLDRGLGSIEIQEADVGIHYDVSDGSDVPVELYRKGIVANDENDYKPNSKRLQKEKRTKRQIDLEDILPFDEDSIEEYVFNFLEGKKNETGLTGLLAQAVTGDTETADAIDELEDDDDDDQEHEER